MSSPSSTCLVTEEEEGSRLDIFLKKRYPEFSRSYFQNLIERKLILLNGEQAKKRTLLAEGDEIEVEFSLTQEFDVKPENIPLSLLFEDKHLLAINKPAGMVVHPAAGNWSGTFANALLYHCKQLPQSNSLRPGIVHRLDKETTGVLLAAKTEEAQEKLVALFAARKMQKCYLAICIGKPKDGLIDMPITRHKVKRKQMTTNELGKPAQTLCEVVSFDGKLSVVHLFPKTGRTHQLRVHLQALHTPILGDKVYGNEQTNRKFHVKRQLLHAYSLSFVHPITNEPLELKAPIPDDMAKFVEQI